MLISKLAKEGKSSAVIGVILRDSYGVPDTKLITGKTITAIMKDKKVAPDVPEDLFSLMKRAVLIRKHLEKVFYEASIKTTLMSDDNPKVTVSC